MIPHRITFSRYPRRRGVAAVEVGAATGLLLAGVLSQLVSASIARADDFSDIVANVEATIAHGQFDFTAAQADFDLGTPAGFADAAALDVAGSNDIFLGSADDLIDGTIQAAAGETPVVSIAFNPAVDPLTPSALETAVSDLFNGSVTELNLAESAFSLGTLDGFVTGLSDSISAFEIDAVLVPQQALIGLADLAGL